MNFIHHLSCVLIVTADAKKVAAQSNQIKHNAIANGVVFASLRVSQR